MKKGGTTALVLVVLVIGVLGAVVLYSGTSSVTGAVPVGKVNMCHCPNFNEETQQCEGVLNVIEISQNAVLPHKAHGDFEAIPDGQGGFTCFPDGGENCGNGVVDAGETCDIGANAGDEGDDVGCDNPNGYGCINCASCESCGDNTINGNPEECDGNDLPAGCTQCQPDCACQTCDDQAFACTIGAANAPKNCAEGFVCDSFDPKVFTGNGDECGECDPIPPPTTTTTTVTTTSTSATTTTTLGCQLGTDECAPAGSTGPGNGCAPGVTCTSACTCTTATTSTTTTQPPSTTSTTIGGGEGGF